MAEYCLQTCRSPAVPLCSARPFPAPVNELFGCGMPVELLFNRAQTRITRSLHHPVGGDVGYLRKRIDILIAVPLKQVFGKNFRRLRGQSPVQMPGIQKIRDGGAFAVKVVASRVDLANQFPAVPHDNRITHKTLHVIIGYVVIAHVHDPLAYPPIEQPFLYMCLLRYANQWPFILEFPFTQGYVP